MVSSKVKKDVIANEVKQSHDLQVFDMIRLVEDGWDEEG
jgi:HKD family nuclease